MFFDGAYQSFFSVLATCKVDCIFKLSKRVAEVTTRFQNF